MCFNWFGSFALGVTNSILNCDCSWCNVKFFSKLGERFSWKNSALWLEIGTGLLAIKMLIIYGAAKFWDIDNMSDLASKYNVRSVPTVVIEEGGVEVDRIVGSVSKQQVLQKLL